MKISCKNYSELFNELTKNHVYSVESMILNVLLPMLQKAYEEQNYELLKQGLQILMVILTPTSVIKINTLYCRI
jgi:peptidoglycan biosynthesis protein MviN/MurJ (putative lipid II flippase)